MIEQVDQLAQHAGFRLPAQSQKQHVMLREDGVLNLGNDRLLVADNAGEKRLAGLQLADEVLAHFILDRDELIVAGFELAESLRLVHVAKPEN